MTRCRLIMQIQTLLFRQRRHHCLAWCNWTMSKHSSTYLAVGFTVNPLRSPSWTLRYSKPRYVAAITRTVLTIVMYLSSEVTRCPRDTIVALMSFLSACDFCVLMIWPVSINLPSSFSASGIGVSWVFCVVDDFANQFCFRRIRVGWVANHHLRLDRHIASSAVAVNLHLEYVFFRWRCRCRYCRNFHRCRSCRHSLVSTRFQSWSGYSRIHFHVKIPLRASSFDRFNVDSIALQVVFCELICT